MRKKFGKWLMDIAKYVVTAGFIVSFFEGIYEEKLVYMVCGTVAVIALAVGLYLQKESLKLKKRK
jgi:ABC-type proline/glycine betaine transport system permease subunit